MTTLCCLSVRNSLIESRTSHGGDSGLRLNDGFDVKLEIVGLSLMIVFGWTLRGLTNVFFSSGSRCWYFSHEPSSLFHHSVLVDLSVSMMMH